MPGSVQNGIKARLAASQMHHAGPVGQTRCAPSLDQHRPCPCRHFVTRVDGLPLQSWCARTVWCRQSPAGWMPAGHFVGRLEAKDHSAHRAGALCASWLSLASEEAPMGTGDAPPRSTAAAITAVCARAQVLLPPCICLRPITTGSTRVRPCHSRLSSPVQSRLLPLEKPAVAPG